MGRRGPKPQPTALRLARGNPSKRALPKNEPKPAKPNRLDPPSWLTGHARQKWRALAPRLATAGLLTVADMDAFARYCDTWARWRQCCRHIDRHGMTYELKDSKGGVTSVQQRPEVSIARSLAVQLARLEAEFGMTPSSRSRVDGRFGTPATGAPAATDPKDDAAKAIGGFDAFVRGRRGA